MYVVEAGGGVAIRLDDLERCERAVKPGLLELARNDIRRSADHLNKASDIIEKHWAQLPEEFRQVLRLSAYQAQNERVSLGTILRHIPQFFKAVTVATQLIMTGGDPAIPHYIKARQRYINTILDAIERETPAYQQDLSQALEGLPSSAENGLTARQYMERLRHANRTSIFYPHHAIHANLKGKKMPPLETLEPMLTPRSENNADKRIRYRNQLRQALRPSPTAYPREEDSVELWYCPHCEDTKG